MNTKKGNLVINVALLCCLFLFGLFALDYCFSRIEQIVFAILVGALFALFLWGKKAKKSGERLDIDVRIKPP